MNITVVVDHVFEPALGSDEEYRQRFEVFRRLYDALRPIYHDTIGVAGEPASQRAKRPLAKIEPMSGKADALADRVLL